MGKKKEKEFKDVTLLKLIDHSYQLIGHFILCYVGNFGVRNKTLLSWLIFGIRYKWCQAINHFQRAPQSEVSVYISNNEIKNSCTHSLW